MYHKFGLKVTGEALIVIRPVTDMNGAEAWRKLSRRCQPYTPMRRFCRLTDIVSVSKSKSAAELAGKLERWEIKVRVYGAETGHNIEAPPKLRAVGGTDTEHDGQRKLKCRVETGARTTAAVSLDTAVADVNKVVMSVSCINESGGGVFFLLHGESQYTLTDKATVITTELPGPCIFRYNFDATAPLLRRHAVYWLPLQVDPASEHQQHHEQQWSQQDENGDDYEEEEEELVVAGLSA